jgi:hypothetical protein
MFNQAENCGLRAKYRFVFILFSTLIQTTSALKIKIATTHPAACILCQIYILSF